MIGEATRMIVYDPFWKTLKERGISTYALINRYGISSNTIHRLRHNLGVTTKLIDELCQILECRPENILQYVPEEN